MTPKIIFDTTVLGMAAYYATARTGIYRATHALVQHLANSVPMSFYSHDMLPESQWATRQIAQLSNLLYVNKAIDIQLSSVENLLIHAISEQLLQKIIRRGFLTTRRFLGKQSFGIDTQEAASFSIYHSPYFPIPNEINKLQHLRKVINFHDIIPVKFPNFFEGNAHQNLIAQIIKSIPPNGLVLCNSENTKNDFCQLSGFAPEQVFVSYLAASQQLFHPVAATEARAEVLKSYGINPEKPYFLSIATLEPRKNIQTVVKAFSALVLSKKYTDIQLVLSGTLGWKYEKLLIEVARNKAVQGQIIRTGYVPDQHLAALYSGAIAFVYPSLYEGFGLPPLEAMQCGCPVVVSNTSSLPEIVGNCGFQVDALDTENLAQQMLRLLESDEIRAKQQELSLARATFFSWKKSTEETLAVYKIAIEI